MGLGAAFSSKQNEEGHHHINLLLINNWLFWPEIITEE
jgi:hypothetical protein